jgi:holin-like protein
MRIIRTVAQIGILTVYYFLGVAIVEVTGIIIPGSIIGLVLLWLSLYFKIIKVQFIHEGATFLLAFLTLFFIPSTVAVINYPELLTQAGAYLIIVVIVSTLLTIVLTGKVSQYIEKKESGEGAKEVAVSPTNISHHR